MVDSHFKKRPVSIKHIIVNNFCHLVNQTFAGKDHVGVEDCPVCGELILISARAEHNLVKGKCINMIS